MTLHIGKNEAGKEFTLPLDIVTQRLAILGRSGVGKSNTAAVAAEEMLKHNQQVVIIDPTGAWWGLRSSADGTSEGFPIVVIGGDHTDIPLDPTAGEVLASAIVERRFSAVIDLENLKPRERAQLIPAFLEALYRLNRTPLHLIIDEADDIAPERPGKDAGPMVEALEDIVKRGRKKGIGTTLITQRPQDLSKKALTQCEMVVTMRLSHQLDRKAVASWINSHADADLADTMLSSLPSLPTGTAWFWAPAWGDLFARVKVRLRSTFDSAATPKPGQSLNAPARLAAVDVAALGAELTNQVEEAKAADPKHLRQRIADLEKQLADAKSGPDAAELAMRMGEVREAQEIILAATLDIHRGCDLIKAWLQRGGVPTERPLSSSPRPTSVVTLQSHVPAVQPRQKMKVANGPAKLPKAERAILAALAQYGRSLDKSRLALIAGYSAGGGGFNNALSNLRTANRVEGSDPITITAQGLADLGSYQRLPTGVKLLEHWISHKRVDKAMRLILGELAKRRSSVEKTHLAVATGYAASGGGFNNALSKLRTLGLVEGSGVITLADALR